MLINGPAVPAEKGATFERAQPARTAASPRARRPPAKLMRWLPSKPPPKLFQDPEPDRPRRASRAAANAADALEAKTPHPYGSRGPRPAAPRCTERWPPVRCAEAASADHADRRRGDSPTCPGCWPWACSRPAWRQASRPGMRPSSSACHRHAAGLRQYGDPSSAARTARAPTSRSSRRCRTRAFRPASSTTSPTAPADAGKVVEVMVAHPAVDAINFTGSIARAGSSR